MLNNSTSQCALDSQQQQKKKKITQEKNNLQIQDQASVYVQF